MCGKCNLLAFELDQTAEGLAAAQKYVRNLEADNDNLTRQLDCLHAERRRARRDCNENADLRLEMDFLKADRDRLRDERNALRDELTALKRRITTHMVGQDVYRGVK